MNYRNHFSQTLNLAFPLIISQIGHVVTTWTDNAFLGQIGLEYQDAGILSGSIFTVILVFLVGMAQGLTPLVAEASLKNNKKELTTLLYNALSLNLVCSILLFSLVLLFLTHLNVLHQPPDVADLAKPFLSIIAASLIPLSLFLTMKQWCEGLSNTKTAMYISIGANILNVILNYLLIFGKFGFPNLGYLGAAWATFISRLLMAVAFFVYFFYHKSLRYNLENLKFSIVTRTTIGKIGKLGIGPGIQYIFEVGAFMFSGVMAGWINKESFAAHGIAIGLASFSYMFASGISGAACIRVAIANGKGEILNLKRAGYSGFLLSCTCMFLFSMVFLIFNKELPIPFSNNPKVLTLSSNLILMACLFQLSDGIQVAGLGALRGMKDVHIPAWIAVTSYWLIALPLAAYFGFIAKLGAVGIWLGLFAGLSFAAITLLLRFRKISSLPIPSLN